MHHDLDSAHNQAADCPSGSTHAFTDGSTDVLTDQSTVCPVDRPCRLYGKGETQVYEDDNQLLDIYNSCEKNRGHKQFIPICNLSMAQIPEGYQSTEMHEFVLNTARLTVKLEVGKTSSKRPEFWPGKKLEYPYHQWRYGDLKRCGSGLIWYVNKYTGAYDAAGRKHAKYTSCTCQQCERSETPSVEWWEMYASTATHVVFDELEAQHTSLRLFYDQQDSPLVTLANASVINANVEDDRCNLRCVTCDPALGEELARLVEEQTSLWKAVFEKYQSCYRGDKKMAFIVSHPHGIYKQVSFGCMIDKTQVGDDVFNHQFNYTACTCPGSSGASVYIVGTTVGWWSFVQHVHSGAVSADTVRRNFSSVGYVK